MASLGALLSISSGYERIKASSLHCQCIIRSICSVRIGYVDLYQDTTFPHVVSPMSPIVMICHDLDLDDVYQECEDVIAHLTRSASAFRCSFIGRFNPIYALLVTSILSAHLSDTRGSSVSLVLIIRTATETKV